jgi:hypothetical protein
MPRQVARPGARLQIDAVRNVRLECPARTIQPVDNDPVRSEIGPEGESAGVVQSDHVGVRPILARRHRARPAPASHARRTLQTAVAREWKDGDGPARVVGDEHVSAGRIDREMAGVGAFRRLLVHQRKTSRGGVDRKCAHRPRGLALERPEFVHRVEDTSARVEGEKRRLFGLSCQRGICREPPRGRIELEQVDPAALAARVRADVDADTAHPCSRPPP